MRANDDGNKAVLPRGFLQASLLLLLSESPSYGYDLYGQVAAMGLRPADAGVVYRALHDLEERGLVVSAREPGRRRPEKRTYRTTARGTEQLEHMAEEIRVVERCLGVYDSRVDQLVAPAHHTAA